MKGKREFSESEIARLRVTCPEKTLQFTLNVLTGLYSSLT